MSKEQLISVLKLLLYFFILVFSVGTVKDGCFGGPTRSVLFAGITETDEFGNVLSVDPGDWCYQQPSFPKLSVTHTQGENFALDLPTTFRLYPAYPNPAKDSVTIRYALPLRTHVKLWIMNRYGQDIVTLVDDTVNAGYSSAVWYLQDSDSRRVGSDIYRAIIEAGQFKCYGDIKVE